MWIILLFSVLTSFSSASQYNYPYVSPSVSYNVPPVAGRNYVFGPDGGAYTSNPPNRNLVGSAITTGAYGSNTANLVSHDQSPEYPGSSAAKFPGNIGNILGGGIGQFLRNAGNFWSGGNTGIFGGSSGGSGTGYVLGSTNPGSNVAVKPFSKPTKSVSSSIATQASGGVGNTPNTYSNSNSGVSNPGKPSAANSALHLFGGSHPGSVVAHSDAVKSFDTDNVHLYTSSPTKVPSRGQGKSKSTSSSSKTPERSTTKKHTRGNRSGNYYTDWNTQTYDESEVLDTEPYNKYFGDGWSSDGLHIPKSAPPVSASLPPIIRKHVYVHLPPTDAESKPSVPIVPAHPPEKHYRIVFIKAPSAPILTAPPAEKNSEKTLIYVLFNKPEDYQIRLPDQPEPTEPTKPEVYFIRYKNPEEEAGKIGKGESEKKEAQSVSVEDDGDIGDLGVGDSVFTGGSRLVHGGDYNPRPLW